MSRKCSSCGADDRPNQTDIGAEHWVKPEIKFINKPEEVTKKLQASGWAYRFFQGRHSMTRPACVPCIRKSKEADEMLRQYRKIAKAAESPNEINYYMALCQ